MAENTVAAIKIAIENAYRKSPVEHDAISRGLLERDKLILHKLGWETTIVNGKPKFTKIQQGQTIFYHLWFYDPENDDIHIIDRDIQGLDAARDVAKAMIFSTGTQCYEYAMVGGQFDQLLAKKAENIRRNKEKTEKYIAEQEAEANKLIEKFPYLQIEKHDRLSEATGKYYDSYELHDTRLINEPSGTMCFYNCEIDDLVYAVENYLEEHKLTV